MFSIEIIASIRALKTLGSACEKVNIATVDRR